ncbi:hypothetical protein BN940_05956 [Castellaniella defragrans 65Phen]|uniref:Uncharacterized protein n=1 Tax=Castellaniella defragrans (strain DSM 12143 / CCUG 39792 / 65Phen) TaxID=1437824 RepID=W8X8U0_CASD6|nr:hypothetical protein BN940_05956 [Castellaniella defragrans 65Phen]
MNRATAAAPRCAACGPGIRRATNVWSCSSAAAKAGRR